MSDCETMINGFCKKDKKALGEFSFNMLKPLIKDYKDFFNKKPTIKGLATFIDTKEMLGHKIGSIRTWVIFSCYCLGKKEIEKRLQK